MKYIVVILLILNYMVANSVQLQIKSGWNLLSIPIDESREIYQMGEFSEIWVYEDKWIKNPSNIDYGVGFWLKSNKDYLLPFEGSEYEINFSNLKDGWNLIGTGVDLNLTEFNFEDSLAYDNDWLRNPSIIKRGSGFWVKNLKKLDDWENMEYSIYDSTSGFSGSSTSGSSAYPTATTTSQTVDGVAEGSGSIAPVESSGSEIGFSVGGAKDIGNFRENIKNNYLPLSTDITYEGLFYDYSFNTGISEECNELFCPSYSRANTPDPLSQKEELYLSVGLNSGITDFKRKKLNLIVVLDISGSMSSSFDSYYYNGEYISESKSKMKLANESVANMTKHLKDSDRFGMVLFDDSAYLVKPLSLVANNDMDKIREHILELTPQGGTNMSAGLNLGFSLFEYVDTNISEYENRVVFLTDAMPNIGVLDGSSLASKIDENSKKGIFTTFIGVGVDFNSELIEFMTKTEGANYYTVHNSNEFNQRLDEEFDFMVTPLVFDLKLTLTSNKYSIERVFGTPEANETTGEIMKINTLFPSKSENSEVKGGIVLIKLKKERDGEDDLNLTVNYRDRSYTPHINSKIVTFDESGEYFENSGIEKGILLTRYANLLKSWIIEERSYCQDMITLTPPPWIDYESIGIPMPPINLSTWERTSCELMVSDEYKKVFSTFRDYFLSESKILNDENLNQEIEVLNFLIEGN